MLDITTINAAPAETLQTGVHCGEDGHNTVLIGLGAAGGVIAACLEPDEARELADRLIKLAHEAERSRNAVTSQPPPMRAR